ncbi:hypothetical protein DFJ77DRAFT_5915 [Powellomyces hirtus]|nr:hypothetical protein DFJ77DRAFT_5915 [Powellomyces hirtus]
MAVGVTYLPSGSPLHFGNLIQKKLGQKGRRCVIICRPKTTADVNSVYELLKKQRLNRLYLKHGRTDLGTNSDKPEAPRDKDDMEILGHLAAAAVTDCPLLIVGTTNPFFIHFSSVSAILDERESGTACNFTVVTQDKEHRFAADMSTDYTEWIYALRDALTCGNQYSYKNEQPQPPLSSKKSFSLSRSTSLSKKFALPTRTPTPTVEQPPVIYDVELDTEEIEQEEIRNSVGEDEYEEDEEDNTPLAQVAAAQDETAEPVPVPPVQRPEIARKRSVTNVRFSERPNSLISEEEENDSVPSPAPAVPAKDIVAEQPIAVADPDIAPQPQPERIKRSSTGRKSTLIKGLADPVNPKVGGMVGAPEAGSSDFLPATPTPAAPLPAQPIANKSFSRKVSTFFGNNNSSQDMASDRPKAPMSPTDSRPRTIGRKFSSFFGNSGNSDSTESLERGRGRTAKQSRGSSPSAPVASTDDPAPREPRSKSLIRMFSRSSSTAKPSDGGADSEERDRPSRSRSRSNTRSRSNSRTRLFTLVPSVRIPATPSLGNMFRRHTGDPEIDDMHEVRGRQ